MKNILRLTVFIGALLSLVMMLPSLSFATTSFNPGEVFDLRNDIRFGDTKDEIRAKETLGINPERTNEYWLQTYTGTVAGFDGVQISYSFVKNHEEVNGLNEVKWTLPTYSNQDDAKSTYEKLYNAIVLKYGEPLDHVKDVTFVIVGDGIDYAFYETWLYGNSSNPKPTGVVDYDEWVVDCEANNNTKIDLSYYYTDIDEYIVLLSYTQFTDEEQAAAMQEKTDEQEAVSGDI